MLFSFNISGSYSIFIYDKINDEIILMNDQIGIYPIYYKTHENKITVSSNISMVSITHNVEEDKTEYFKDYTALRCQILDQEQLLKISKGYCLVN